MVSRVEGVLIAALLFFGGRSMLTELSLDMQDTTSREKEMELFSFSLKEVNQTALLHTIGAQHMVKYHKEVIYEDFTLYTPDLTLLSPRAIQKNKTIFLDQNATILKTDGSRYYTDHATYHRESGQLELSGHFAFSDRYGDVKGTEMDYDVRKKEIQAAGIKAVYEIE